MCVALKTFVDLKTLSVCVCIFVFYVLSFFFSNLSRVAFGVSNFDSEHPFCPLTFGILICESQNGVCFQFRTKAILNQLT